MWVARNKQDSYESDSIVLWLDDEKPSRIDNGEGKSQYWFGVCGIELKPHTKLYDKYAYLTWEHDPVEVELVSSMLNSVQEKLAESVDEYFDYVGHVQDIHPYSKEEEQNLYNKMCWRWQDWGDIKYDNPSTWDLNFDDYE